MVKEKYDKSGTKVFSLGLEKNALRFWIYVAISVIALLCVFISVRYFSKNKDTFIRVVSVMLCVFVVSYSEYILFLGKSETDQSDDFVINYALNFGEDISIKDIKNVRSDFYESMDNIGMFWQIPNIQAFHSIVPSSTMDFYNTIGSERDVASRPETDFYGLRGLLSVKYLFDACEDDSSFVNPEGGKLMPGYKHIGKQNGFDIYENKYYVPMGFMYDEFICEEEFKDLSDNVKHLALMKAMVLSQQQMQKYSEITGYTDGMYLYLNEQYRADKPQNLAYPNYENYDSITTTFQYSYEDYFTDCKERKATACDSFSYTKNGFTATITNDGDDNLLFFSVPYDKGFKAYVNGKETEIEKVNIGFMAVKVDGHKTSQIEFVYTTPLLRTGIIISCIGFFIFAVYMTITRGFRCKRKFRKTYFIKQL